MTDEPQDPQALPELPGPLTTLIEDEMKRSYVTYAMSVIVSRALPDVRDGLKPVHRRVLFGMENLALRPGRPYKKSARIVGDVIGKYHPHGDAAVYHTLVRLAQNFSMRYPLVDGQGNFGSIDGDSPAAMRYTEARMTRIAELMLDDLEKETVDFVPNYDSSMEEPTVLPSAVPNLLVNGSTGIAVGMATSIPPHNLREITDGCIALLENPQMDDAELLTLVSGPDFPTGGIIYGRSGIQLAYLKGRGRIQVRAKMHFEDMPNGRQRIVVTEIPYQVNKGNLLEKMGHLVREKIIEGIADLRDESDRHGMRIAVDLKKDAFAEVVSNQLLKYTQLQDTYSIINLALVDGKPMVLTLKEMIQGYLKHRLEVLLRKSRFELARAEERAHILEGLRIAIQNIDEVIAIIRASQNAEAAKKGLQNSFSLSEKQAHAIVEMRLRTLTGLEIEKIESEYADLVRTIADLKDILASETRQRSILKDNLLSVAEKYGDERRTEIVDVADEVTHLDLIPNESMVVTVSHAGYIKRIAADEYRAQGRGGRGITGAGLKDEDFVERLFVAMAHSYLLVFTNLGRCHWLRVYEIPETKRTSKGKALVNLVRLQAEEKVTAWVQVEDFETDQSVIFATEQGIINKMSLNSFSNPRAGGVHAIKLDSGDRLIGAMLAAEDGEVMIGTRLGQAIRFKMKDFRRTQRGTRGVRGIRLAPKDRVVGMIVPEDDVTVLTVTENGFAKRTRPADYRRTQRGGKGVVNIRITSKNGPAVAVGVVRENQNLMILSRQGIIIMMKTDSISVLGRATQGVRAIRLAQGDTVADAEILDATEEELAAFPSPSAQGENGDGEAAAPQEPPPLQDG